MTAEIAEPTEAEFIPRAAFLHFLREHGEAALRVTELMGEVVHTTYDEVRSLGLAGSTEEKLAAFLLDWWDRHLKKRGPQRVKLTLTQEEIAEAIGATRETVTRLFTEFRRRKVIDLQGANLTIADRAALERLIGTRPRTRRLDLGATRDIQNFSDSRGPRRERRVYTFGRRNPQDEFIRRECAP